MTSQWNAKAVERLIVEAAETMMLLPRVSGPKAYGNSMPAPRRSWEDYGREPSRYIRRATPAEIDRMMLAVEAINRLEAEGDRVLIHAWSWQKARRGKFLNDFAVREGVNSRTLRRQITRLCQRIADDLLQRRIACFLTVVDDVSEIAAESDPSRVSSPNRVKPDPVTGIYAQMEPGTRPRHDPESPELKRLIKRLERQNRKRKKSFA